MKWQERIAARKAARKDRIRNPELYDWGAGESASLSSAFVDHYEAMFKKVYSRHVGKAELGPQFDG